ncbi:histidine phosphatase superfamily [Pelagophyceae sp. CCMP2097]|nr:histidine phosphatase superfamily [Pelagophyceae sp. CCMP2097]
MESLPPPAPHVLRLYLIRHGQTDWNAEGRIQGCSVDRPLSDVGEAQANAVANALQDVPLDAVGSSTLMRASQTADAILRANRNAPRRLAPAFALREMNFGSLEGQVPAGTPEYEEVNEAWAAGELDRRWPGGESPNDVSARGVLALADVVMAEWDAQRPRHVAIVAHGRFNKIVLAALLEGYGVQRCGEISQDNCCINVLDVTAPTLVGHCTSVAINAHAHLQL